MTHVILGHCCKDASCVKVCPQNCIHPAPGEPGFGTAATLHIDPRTCIDCTACVEACPASAIKSEFDLTSTELPFARINEEFFRGRARAPRVPAPRDTGHRALAAPLRIAVVGAGPAALYTVREILQRSGSARITVFEKHEEIGGLLRRGVSHADSRVRDMIALFGKPFGDDRVTVLLGTEIGVDIAVDELRREFDAVVLACGATRPRTLGHDNHRRIPGFHHAIDIIAADNAGLPAPAGAGDLGPVCLVVGGGNVAMDLVRHIVTRDEVNPGGRPVEQILVLSRTDRVAFTPSVFLELALLHNVDLVRDGAGLAPRAAPNPVVRDISELPVIDIAEPPVRGRTRVVFSFGSEATGLEIADGRSLRVSTGAGRTFGANSVVSAAGFQVTPIRGVPLSERGTVAHRAGRVVDPVSGAVVDRLYVTGWAKRGPVGGVGDNRVCAAETVAALADDLAEVRSGELARV
ncbi:FAD-dependent oxidoreductase [Nocardia asteroides]|uniref:FAD-dependent oxidoreductase n=1 Tax=Nocardia asteroides TaxID=1824 RepID=UPI001E452A5F|nr:FAD-dependent oxidoreductase [Nocardia asteroides]UGT61921.1 FAD-dependent oxidoreductase [Nocardia asteroides]